MCGTSQSKQKVKTKLIKSRVMCCPGKSKEEKKVSVFTNYENEKNIEEISDRQSISDNKVQSEKTRTVEKNILSRKKHMAEKAIRKSRGRHKNKQERAKKIILKNMLTKRLNMIKQEFLRCYENPSEVMTVGEKQNFSKFNKEKTLKLDSLLRIPRIFEADVYNLSDKGNMNLTKNS